MAKIKKKYHSEVPKFIRTTAQILEKISPKLATSFAVKLFTTPIKYKLPKREIHWYETSNRKKIKVPTIQKEIVVYEYIKNSTYPNVLLVHGWSGRGTQLVKIGEALLEKNFNVYSFDAPAHGFAPGKQTIMTEFIASIQHLEAIYGSFDLMVGHSLGSMSILNSLARGSKTNKIVLIGSGDKIEDIVHDFVSKVGLSMKIAVKLQEQFEKKFNEPMSNYDAYKAAQKVNISALVIHDQNDHDVSVEAGKHIAKHLSNSQWMETKGLGHRKILGDKQVIDRILTFVSYS
ncbi:MAG: alpha/beta hydrolase [Flavobacterium sp.]